ncbi:MAG: UPF0149 family protein [Chlorobiaceae bacterium]|nr:UPF0149 family protein [Chlorobiaceae bacterium]
MINSERPLLPLSQDELTELETFLASNETPEDCMSSLEMIDGFMTALVIGPETVSSDTWIPYLLNPEKQSKDVFADEAQALQISSLLERHIGAISNQFGNAPDAFLPIYEMFSYGSDEERELAIEEWALGFILGMELSHEAWQPLFGNEESAMLAGPVFVLGKITEDYDTLSQEERDELADMLDESIVKMFTFWQQNA